MISYPNVKVNLGLEVLRKSPDGFHDIETLFVPYFGIYDTLEIVAGDDYSKTSASLFARYGEDEVVQGISEDGKLMITIVETDVKCFGGLGNPVEIKMVYMLPRCRSVFIDNGERRGAHGIVPHS